MNSLDEEEKTTQIIEWMPYVSESEYLALLKITQTPNVPEYLSRTPLILGFKPKIDKKTVRFWKPTPENDEDDHPMFYVDKGVCPFECCTYRKWNTTNPTNIYAEPNSNECIGAIGKGNVVEAQTGEVYTKPGKLIVRRNVTNFQEGDILWVYTYLGEGYFKIWYKGKFIEDQIDFNYRDPSTDDWGYFEIMPHSVWWVKIKTPSGLEGWISEPENFSNKDACNLKQKLHNHILQSRW